MIATREISYDADGLTMRAHLARPQGPGPWPAVLVGHDGIGLHDYQRGRADALAERGVVALAMDYHGGQMYTGRPDAMLERVMPLIADPDRMRAIGYAALDVLRAEPGADLDRLAALGYGAGGSIVLELARSGLPFTAVAAVHPGLLDAQSHPWTDMTASVLLCTGSNDPICTPAQLLTFGRTLGAAGAEWRASILGGAEHAFWAPPTDLDGSPIDGTRHAAATVPGVGYHPAHTERSWRDVLGLFGDSVGTTTRPPT